MYAIIFLSVFTLVSQTALGFEMWLMHDEEKAMVGPTTDVLAAWGGNDRSVHLYDMTTSSIVRSFERPIVEGCDNGQSGKITTVKFSSDFSKFIAAAPGWVGVFDTPTGQLLWEQVKKKLVYSCRVVPTALDISPDGRTGVWGFGSQSFIFSMENGEILDTLDHSISLSAYESPRGAFFSGDGAFIYIGFYTGIGSYSIHERKYSVERTRYFGEIYHSHDRSMAIVNCGRQSDPPYYDRIETCVVGLNGHEIELVLRGRRFHSETNVVGYMFLPSDERVATINPDYKASEVWDLDTNDDLASFRYDSSERFMEFVGDSHFLVVQPGGVAGNKAVIRDLELGQ